MGNDADFRNPVGWPPTDTSRPSARLDVAPLDRKSCPMIAMSASVCPRPSTLQWRVRRMWTDSHSRNPTRNCRGLRLCCGPTRNQNNLSCCQQVSAEPIRSSPPKNRLTQNTTVEEKQPFKRQMTYPARTVCWKWPWHFIRGPLS